MSTINTNINSIKINNALAKNQRDMTLTMEKLSTGSRLNRASDDAAGISIAESMTAQINGVNAAVRNSNDAISMLQTADAGMSNQSSLMQRMRELSVLAINDTYSTSQKAALSTEFKGLASQIDTIANKTQWNGVNLLSGSYTSSLTFQIGANASDTLAYSIASMTLNNFGLSALSLGTASDATIALSALSGAMSTLNTQRSGLGATINRLTHAVDNLTSVAQNAYESRSKIADTDYAAATSDLARQQIIQQAGTAMLAQANQMPSMVLALLR